MNTATITIEPTITRDGLHRLAGILLSRFDRALWAPMTMAMIAKVRPIVVKAQESGIAQQFRIYAVDGEIVVSQGSA